MPKIPFKSFVEKLKGPIKHTIRGTKAIDTAPLHQRTVFGSIVAVGEYIPEREGFDITDEIMKLRKEYGVGKHIRGIYTKKTPLHINSGECFDFACDLHGRMGGQVVGDEDTGRHYWLFWKGRYYDAENPKGVKHLEHLDFFKRIPGRGKPKSGYGYAFYHKRTKKGR